jgi:hypothetical protein
VWTSLFVCTHVIAIRVVLRIVWTRVDITTDFISIGVVFAVGWAWIMNTGALVCAGTRTCFASIMFDAFPCVCLARPVRFTESTRVARLEGRIVTTSSQLAYAIFILVVIGVIGTQIHIAANLVTVEIVLDVIRARIYIAADFVFIDIVFSVIWTRVDIATYFVTISVIFSIKLASIFIPTDCI